MKYITENHTLLIFQLILIFQSGFFQQALLRLQKIVDHLDPNNLDVKQNLAFLAISNEDTVSSIKYYQNILSSDNSKSDIWFNLGLIYAYQGKFNSAEKCWKKTIEINPNDKTAIKYLESLSKVQELPFYETN